MNITLSDYFMGRDKDYPTAMTPDIERNAVRTVGLVNELLKTAALHGIALAPIGPGEPGAGTLVASGWRPPALNATTPRAAKNSKHMLGLACDVNDDDGDLDAWLMTEKGRAALEAIGLWMEHPVATKGYCHVQTVPPGSGNRVFYP